MSELLLTPAQFIAAKLYQIADHHGLKELDFLQQVGLDGNWELSYENYLEWYLKTRTPLGKAMK